MQRGQGSGQGAGRGQGGGQGGGQGRGQGGGQGRGQGGGQGGGRGRGQGGGRGRMGGTRPGAGPAGDCICPGCGEKVAHRQGIPCQEEHCPVCGAKLLREGSHHHKLFEEKQAKSESGQMRGDWQTPISMMR